MLEQKRRIRFDERGRVLDIAFGKGAVDCHGLKLKNRKSDDGHLRMRGQESNLGGGREE